MSRKDIKVNGKQFVIVQSPRDTHLHELGEGQVLSTIHTTEKHNSMSDRAKERMDELRPGWDEDEEDNEDPLVDEEISEDPSPEEEKPYG